MRLSRRGIIVALVVALAGAGVVYGSVRLLSGETVLYLEPDNPGPDPFTDPAVFAEDIEITTTTTLPVTTTLAASPSPGATASPGASPSPTATASPGATPSPDPSATTTIPTFVAPPEPVFAARRGECDVQTLIEYLSADQEMADAWLNVLGIDSQQFEEYVLTLTPTILSRDARVTTYSYVDGEAQEYQAILTEGNAVLIDSIGELVVRCYSGSPLAPPRQIRYQCEGCPEDYSPPPPCEQTCFVEPTTTTTTLPVTTTTSLVESTTTSRRSTASTTRAGGAAATTTRAGATTTRPGAGATTTRAGTPTTATTAPTTTTTAPQGTTTSTICILPGICLN